MLYNVNGEIIQLNQGDGIFINARQLHYGFSDDHQECVFICVLIHPMLLCSSHHLEKKFAAPVLSDNCLPYHLLHHTVDWEQKILVNVRAMHESLPEPTAELLIQSQFNGIWSELYKHRRLTDHMPVVRNHNLHVLKIMIAYIQEHYRDKVSLADIAKAGNVGKTSCCAIFQNFINKTPNTFLTDYRLRKGAELLLSTDMTIAEICYEVGFSGASYFTETFRKGFGCSPGQYRKNSQQNTHF